ncbi:MAG: hypothetical protein F8N37_12040 [Telmatospirillum sp.]|nr:hypothetical protein [Telmatospirillum sp.]
MSDKQVDFDEVAFRCLKGRRDAVVFIKMMCDILHTWDDLIDRDKPVDPEAINRAFFTALVTLPRDPFYAANFALLNPIVETAIYNWWTANLYEASSDEDRLRAAFILRSSYSDIATMCARIVGGPDWARTVGPEIHDHWHGEGWAKYLLNLEHEKECRA